MVKVKNKKPFMGVIQRDFLFQKLPNLEKEVKPILEQRSDENKGLDTQVSAMAHPPKLPVQALYP